MAFARSARLPDRTFVLRQLFAHDGDRLVTTARIGDDFQLAAWDTRTAAPVWTQPIRRSTSFVIGHDQSFVATRDPDQIALWNLDDGSCVRRFAPSLPITAALAGGRLALLLDVPLHRPDGTTVDEGTRLATFDTGTGAIEAHFGLHRRVGELVVAADGANVIAIDAPSDGVGFALWDTSGRQRASFVGRGGSVLFRPSRDELVLTASLADDGMPVVFDARTGARVAVLGGADAVVAECMAAAISPEGRWLVTANADVRDNHNIVDQRIFVWDLEARRHHQTVELDGPGYANAVAFRGDQVIAVEAGTDLTFYEIDLVVRG